MKLGALIKKRHDRGVCLFFTEADTFEGMTSDTDVNCKKLQTYKPLPVENILLVLNY